MARILGEEDVDRYLVTINGRYHYKRRVPASIAHLDKRAPHVRASLKTKDLVLARRKRDQMEAADDAYWASLMTDGVTDLARRRYDAAVRRVEAMGFTFRSSKHFERPDAFHDLVDRLRVVMDSRDEHAVAPALLGAVEVPKTTISKAFDIYVDDIVAADLIGKSKVQRDQWRKVKLRAVNNFISLVSDKAMEDITVEDAQKIHQYWNARIAPKEGRRTASASSGNRDLGNLRVLYSSYFTYNGDRERKNPFDGFSFSTRIKKSRPPIPTEWIRGTILKPGTLATLNEEARGILLIMIETGARPSEICNLEPDAIRVDQTVPHLAIEPRIDPDDPREIKTASSRRLVPLVGVALEAAKRHQSGFPRYRNRENDLSATLNKYLRTNKLFPTKDHKVYSFRHSFEDRMKDGGLEDELRRILMGHTIDRPKYGSGGSLEWRRDELMKIVLPFDPAIV
jgi:integrase